MPKDKITPVMRQYQAIKARHQDALLFFRMGDFYELFFEDAVIASKAMDVALTSRNRDSDDPIPMCGVPFHAAEGYLGKLIRKGHRVAICEQVEDPKAAKGLVRREVTRVISPGTVTDTELLEARDNNFLCSLALDRKKGAGLAFVDLSTGRFLITESGEEDLLEFAKRELGRFRPREIIYPEPDSEFAGTDGNSAPDALPEGGIEELLRRAVLEADRESLLLGTWQARSFDERVAYATLTGHFGTPTLEGFGCEGRTMAIRAAGGLLSYLNETQKASLAHIDSLTFCSTDRFMVLDPTTVRNLELTVTLDGSRREGSLIQTLDRTLTGMGGRKLKDWFLRPLLDLQQIVERQDGIEELAEEAIIRDKVRRTLKQVHDLERLLSKTVLGTAGARDLVALRLSLEVLPDLMSLLGDLNATLSVNLRREMDLLEDVQELLETAVHPEPPISLRDGGLIRKGFSEELDKLRAVSRDGKATIAGIEVRERERTGISSLKVKYNKVFGYYIEVSKSNLAAVPDDYDRKQTLVGSERFITPELKEYEATVLGAQERIIELEYRLFTEVRERTAAEAGRIKATADKLATLDAISALAETAVRNQYVRPRMHTGQRLSIKAGRHPVVELLSPTGERFIPNDLELDNEENQILIITGPNMGGKSTYLRQAALITLMAHTGSFVPAAAAEIPMVDRIFTRVGASDFLIRGQSTFMVEMIETANILNNATSRSLVILDEVGRGTSTFDGVSIAWAVVEYLHNSPEVAAKTLFATHFYELTELAHTLTRLKNVNISVKEWNDEIIFLREVVDGAADRSYGVQVARLAGLPKQVLERAKEILTNLEQNAFDREGTPRLARHRTSPLVPPGTGSPHHAGTDQLRNEEVGTAEHAPSADSPGKSEQQTEIDGADTPLHREDQDPTKTGRQMRLFNLAEDPLFTEIRYLDLNRMTPLEALAFLHELQKRVK